MARTSGGQPGNHNAVKNRPWREALDRAIKRDDRGLLDLAAQKVLEGAAAGDMNAIKELGNRLDGRPVQAVDMQVDQNIGLAERMQAAQERVERARAEDAQRKSSALPDFLQ